MKRLIKGPTSLSFHLRFISTPFSVLDIVITGFFQADQRSVQEVPVLKCVLNFIHLWFSCFFCFKFLLTALSELLS